MPPRDPNPKRPSPPPAEPLDWHGKRGAKPSAGGAAWQRPSAVVGHAKRPWLRIFVTGLLLVLVAFFVYEVIQSNEPTPLIACAFTGYELPLPPNAWAFEDVEDFKKHARPFSARSNLVWRGFDEEQRLPQTQWLEKLKKAIEQPSPKEDLPVLIYLSAHGVVDRAGRPCLVAPGAESKPEHWLHVEELVKELDQNATRKHRVILFLDANRLAAHWGLGVLYSDFADRLQNALDKAKAQNVLIVNSTSPGQVGWTSQKLGGSIFAQCVVNGLTGAASTDGNVVTLEDLLVYINFRGSHWTDENRGAIQNPLLIAPGAAQVDLKMKLAEVPSGWQERVFTMFAKRAPIDRALGGADKFDERIKESLEKSEAYWETLVKFIETGEPSETLFDALRLRRELAHWQQRMAAGNDEARMANDDFPALADRITKLTKRPPGARYSLWRDADDGDPELVAWRQCYDSHREESIDALRRQIPTSDGGERPEPIEWRWARMLAAENALRPPATKLLFLALAQRNLAEKAAWPRDVRAHYAVRAFADDVDRRRRSADDAIFLGGPAELEQAKAHYEEAVAQYTAIAAAGKVLSDAFRQCDRASCELLDLAQSIDLAMRFSDSEETANSGAALLDAIDKTHRLRDGLDELVQDGDRRAADDLGGRPLDADELQRRADDLARSAVELAEELRSLTAQHKAALTKGPPAFWDLSFSPTPAVLGVDNVLKRFYDLFAADARLTPGPLAQDERTKARNEWKNLPGTGLSKNDGKETVNSGAPKSDEPRLPRWSKHPATAILRLATEPLTRPSAYDELRETFHTQGTKVVEPLARFGEGPQPPTGGSAKPQEASDLPDVAPPQSAMAARKRLADDEAGILAAAALLVEYSDGRESFVPRALRLPHFDQASFLTWQARRAVDDYWGPHAWRPETGGGAGGTEAAPYYRRLARALLKEAATIKERTDWKVEQSPDAKFVLAKVLDDRYQFTLDLSNPEASDKDDEDSASADVKWWYTFEPAPDAGLAALFVLGGDGTAANEPARPSDARLREAVDLSESQHRERMNRFTHVAAESTLRLYFRGHVAENEIGPARKRPRREIRHVLAKRGEATIRVRREAPFDLQVVFLLDCSGSMQVDTNGMPAFLSGQRITRMEAAKESLASLLEGLADQQGVEVGISLFGATYHTQAKRKSQWVEEIAAEAARQGLEITSGNDILSIAPLNVWSSKEFQNFKARYLSRIVARGQTPLYFAIAEAVRREFPREIAAKRQLLVIISDGENYVENDPHAEMTKSPRQAIDELDARKWLEVYVLNCGDDAGTQGKLTKEVFDKLDRLRPKPQVFPNPPADLDEFSARLRDAVRVPQYEYAVFNPAKPAAPGRRIWLGQKKGIKISSRTPYELFEADRFGRDRSRRFLVEGGENLIWWLSASGSGLEAQRLKKYENVAERAQRGKVPNPFFGHVPDVDLNPATFQVVAGEPVRNGAGDLEFRIAIENGDPKAFSPRPVESWIEIKPRRGEGAEPDVLKDTPYQFCDATYDQDDTGAPVLICKAPDWPHDAGEAEIRAWWSLEEEFDPAVREPIDQTVDKLIRSPPRVFATDEAGQQVSITVESPPRKIGDLGASVIVTQEQQPADAGFRPMRVHSVDPPDETIRRYFPATGKRGWRVVHEFIFREDQARVREHRLQIAPRRLLHVGDDKAAHVDDGPIVVSIPQP